MLIKTPLYRRITFALAGLIAVALIVTLLIHTVVTQYCLFATLAVYSVAMAYFVYKEGNQHRGED